MPEMKKWFSVDEFDTKRNTSGVEYFGRIRVVVLRWS